MQAIYFDYAATTPVDPRVAERMSQCLTLEGLFGNPASRSHSFGWAAEAAVEEARGQVASALHCDVREVIWTSGATESNNLALKGVFEAVDWRGHLIVSQTEHKAVLDTCRWLESRGVAVSYVAPNAGGQLTVGSVEKALRPDTVLVSAMLVNNETGAINDLFALGALTRKWGVLLHSDAAQALGKIPIALDQLPVDLMSFSGHKVYGPKGIGALYVRRAPEVRVAAQMHGGGHERGYRSGTLATHQIAGLGLAVEIAVAQLESEYVRLEGFRRRLLAGVSESAGFVVNGEANASFPGIVNFSFDQIDGESLMLGLRRLAISSGSACASASVAPSHVLSAMGVSEARALGSIRLSMGRFTTAEDVDVAIAEIQRVVAQLQSKGR